MQSHEKPLDLFQTLLNCITIEVLHQKAPVTLIRLQHQCPGLILSSILTLSLTNVSLWKAVFGRWHPYFL